MNEKLSLPSIKDLLEGGPGLIDYSSSSRHQQDQLNKSHRQKSYLQRHRRHASEHITSSSNYSRQNIMLTQPPPMPPLPSLTTSPTSTVEHTNYTPSSLFTNDDNNMTNQPIRQYNSASIMSNQYPAPTSSITAPLAVKATQDTIGYAANTSLPHEMQQLSLGKNPQEIMPLKPLLPRNVIVDPSSSSSSSKNRTHARSYSDFTHSYTSTHSVPPKLSTMNESKSMSTAASTSSLPALLPTPATKQKKESLGEKKSQTEKVSNHQETIIQNARYVCPYCRKGFTRPSSLRTHIYSHTGEKPFVCSEPSCGKKFSVQSNLRRHLRIHRLNKPTTLFLPKNIN